ncbi:hypothetical protein NDU88_006729 [Pleurodeles waltl]|uniref:Uncharacterized protein n=1 Tax=Pleurodeles waltl TaxID=8319 RepID=A0AAV7N4W8_PLEWA|nr:hypothetical protein NDU88_006729 [Pleurodeles waltl]
MTVKEGFGCEMERQPQKRKLREETNLQPWFQILWALGKRLPIKRGQKQAPLLLPNCRIRLIRTGSRFCIFFVSKLFEGKQDSWRTTACQAKCRNCMPSPGTQDST